MLPFKLIWLRNQKNPLYINNIFIIFNNIKNKKKMRLIYLLFGLLAVINCESASQIFKNMTEIPGFIELDNKGDNLFYWLFPSQNNASTSPIVVWLTGGPGCSSELAIFYENGPFKINDDLSLKLNPYSWNLHANMLYVD